jgi:hypothetical protein
LGFWSVYPTDERLAKTERCPTRKTPRRVLRYALTGIRVRDPDSADRFMMRTVTSARTLTCPNKHHNRSAKVTRRISGKSKPRASESLSFCICRINSNEHSAKRYARSGPGQPLAPEQRDKLGASSSQQSDPENKGGDVSGTGVSPWRRT